MIALGDSAPDVVNHIFQGHYYGSDMLDPLQTDVEYFAVMRGLRASDPMVKVIPQRHSGKWNVVFCDGHVENLITMNLFDEGRPEVARRWNTDNQSHNENWAAPSSPGRGYP
jgi:prepilin-type processing-associated H-X9-DG protein